MKKIQDGYQNEFLFVMEFNNKKIKELNPMLRQVIDDLYPSYPEDAVIKSWRNHNNQEKGDILLKVNGHLRSISIKMGSRNSVHMESLKTFKYFLSKNGVDSKTIEEYEKYHYGADDFSQKILSASEYSLYNQDSIKMINKKLANISHYNIAERFLLKGNVSYYEVDGIIHGTPHDFLWINKHEVREILKENLSRESKSVHYGCLFIQPFNRCMNDNNKYAWGKDYVQIKWYSLFDDIIKYKNDRICKEQ